MNDDFEQELARMERDGRGEYVPLLYITPPATRSEQPSDDELTDAMRAAFDQARVVQTWRGWHTCACGERSTNRDYEGSRRFQDELAVRALPALAPSRCTGRRVEQGSRDRRARAGYRRHRHASCHVSRAPNLRMGPG